MVDAWFFEYVLDADRFFCPQERWCARSDKREQDTREPSDEPDPGQHMDAFYHLLCTVP
jgi:hypothetical protein